jgi:DNA-binding transcriptional LysR family regulator
MAVQKSTTSLESTTSLDWEDLRIFERLVEAQTLSAAARALGITHVTVARRLERLEAQFGAPLFERRPSGYRLTALGEAAYAHAQQMHAAGDAIARLRDRRSFPRAAVRISVPRTLADSFVVPNLSRIADALADVELVVITDTRLVSIAKWEADIAIRLGDTPESEMVRRKVGTMHYRLVAKIGTSPDAALIGDPDDSTGSEALWLRTHAANRPFAFRSNSQVAQYQAAIAGLGIALLPTFLRRDGDGLTVIDDRAHPPSREIALLTRREALRAPHLRRTFDALIELFRLGWQK